MFLADGRQIRLLDHVFWLRRLQRYSTSFTAAVFLPETKGKTLEASKHTLREQTLGSAALPKSSFHLRKNLR